MYWDWACGLMFVHWDVWAGFYFYSGAGFRLLSSRVCSLQRSCCYLHPSMTFDSAIFIALYISPTQSRQATPISSRAYFHQTSYPQIDSRLPVLPLSTDVLLLKPRLPATQPCPPRPKRRPRQVFSSVNPRSCCPHVLTRPLPSGTTRPI